MDRSYNNSFGAGETGGDIILPAAGKKSRKGLVAAIVIVLLVLVGAGVGVWFALQPKGNDNGSPNAGSTALVDRIVYNFRNLETVRGELINSYKDGGLEKATEYYDNNIVCSQSDKLRLVCNYEENYFDEVLAEYIVFSEAGCAVDDEYDWACAETYYGAEELAQELLVASRVQEYLAELQGDEFRAMVDEVSPLEDSEEDESEGEEDA